MLTAPELASIHHQLQIAAPRSPVLLWGSYYYNEQIIGSDADFYIICTPGQFFKYRRLCRPLLEIKKQFPAVNIMLVPTVFGRSIWYFIYGKNSLGATRRFTVPLPVILTNCLKLAYYNYVVYCAAGAPRALLKAIKQAATADILRARPEDLKTQEIFSWKYLLNNRGAASSFGQTIIGAGNAVRAQMASGAVKIDKELANQALAYINEVFGRVGPAPFLWRNYLLYNLHFLPRGQRLFLKQNPDKLVLTKIRALIQSGERAKAIAAEMRDIIFPVFIL